MASDSGNKPGGSDQPGPAHGSPIDPIGVTVIAPEYAAPAGALRQLGALLRLTRVTTAVAAVGNVWFVILWTRAAEQEPGTEALRDRPLWLLLIAGAIGGLGLFGFGTCLNDVLDLRRDRILRPDRPMVSGGVTVEGAVIAACVTLLLSVFGAAALGLETVVVTLVVAVVILFFNAIGKFVPGIGLVVLGLIYAGHMLAPNPNLRFLWPLWLVMTHALVVAYASHKMARRVPRISGRAMTAAIVGWVFWSGVLLAVSAARSGDASQAGNLWLDWAPPYAWLWPAGLAVLFALVAIRKGKAAGGGARGAEKIWRYGSLWLPLYGAGWLIGAGFYGEAVVMGALALGGFAAMTVLREVYGLIDRPLAYQR